jgi:hypothetical protein
VQRQIEFAAELVINRVPVGNVKELRRRAELLPQLSCAGSGMTRFRRREAFEVSQHRAQGTEKLELLSPTCGGVRQQRELFQPLFKLRGRFRPRRTGGGLPTGPAPKGDGFFDEPSLGVMLREELGLALHHLGGMGFERFGDLRVQLLPGIAQQPAVRRVLHQCVLETIDRVGRRAALEDQLGGDKASEGGLQFVVEKAGHGT